MLYVQFTDAIDPSNKENYKPRTSSYLILRGPAGERWVWVGRDLADPQSTEPLIRFGISGEVTVRIRGGMEGVGFDLFFPSPARHLE